MGCTEYWPPLVQCAAHPGDLHAPARHPDGRLGHVPQAGVREHNIQVHGRPWGGEQGGVTLEYSGTATCIEVDLIFNSILGKF